MSAVFLLDQVLACTESATSKYSTTSQCLSALLGTRMVGGGVREPSRGGGGGTINLRRGSGGVFGGGKGIYFLRVCFLFFENRRKEGPVGSKKNEIRDL